MLKRLNSIEKADRAIAETEIAITEQVLRIAHAEARGRSTKTARRMLMTMYGLLAEYHHARNTMVEARKLTGESGPG